MLEEIFFCREPRSVGLHFSVREVEFFFRIVSDVDSTGPDKSTILHSTLEISKNKIIIADNPHPNPKPD